MTHGYAGPIDKECRVTLGKISHPGVIVDDAKYLLLTDVGQAGYM